MSSQLLDVLESSTDVLRPWHLDDEVGDVLVGNYPVFNVELL